MATATATATAMATAGAIVVVVDGEIGAGKTSLIEVFAEHLRSLGKKVAVVPEPVEEWKKVGILQAFYANPKELAYTFQTFTFVTRVLETCRILEETPDADIYLLERSILTDRYVFMELQRPLFDTPMTMLMYEKWWNAWQRIMPIWPTQQIYLKPVIETCQRRVLERSRDGEIVDAASDAAPDADVAKGGVSAAYQVRLREAHEAFVEGKNRDKFPGMPEPFGFDRVTVVTGELAEGDFRHDGDVRDRLMAWLSHEVLT